MSGSTAKTAGSDVVFVVGSAGCHLENRGKRRQIGYLVTEIKLKDSIVLAGSSCSACLSLVSQGATGEMDVDGDDALRRVATRTRFRVTCFQCKSSTLGTFVGMGKGFKCRIHVLSISRAAFDMCCIIHTLIRPTRSSSFRSHKEHSAQSFFRYVLRSRSTSCPPLAVLSYQHAHPWGQTLHSQTKPIRPSERSSPPAQSPYHFPES